MVDNDVSEQSLRSLFPKLILESLQARHQKNFGFDSFTFEIATNSSTFDSSCDWFGNYGLISNIDGNSESNENANNMKTMFDHATKISWSESRIGIVFREKLKRFEDSHSLALYSPSTHQSDFLWACNSALRNGYPLMQMGEVWRDNTDQKEFIFWYTDALVRTRPPKNAPKVDLALSLHIPNLFQSAMYIGENVEQQLLGPSLHRGEVFSVNGIENLPRITMHTENDCLSFGLIFVDDHYEPNFIWAPQSIRLGYVFESSHLELDLENLFESMINSLSRVGEILADGFCNFSEVPERDFQSICFSDRSLNRSSSTPAIELGDFVPGCLYAHLTYLTQDFFQSRYSSLEQALQVNDLEQIKTGLKELRNIMNDGYGASFMSAANYLFYIQLKRLSEGHRDLSWLQDAKICLKYVSDLDLNYENANALSNLAGVSIEEGDLETALDYITRGRRLIVDAPFQFSEVVFELMGYQLKVSQGLGLNLETTNIAEEILEWARGRTLRDEQEEDIYSEARATIGLSPNHQNKTLDMLSKLDQDTRDGVAFDLMSHLGMSVERGSKLARLQLDTINHFLHNSAELFDKEVKDTLQLWEGQFRDLYSELGVDLEDFVLSEEFGDLVEELTESWAEFFDRGAGVSIYPETIVYIFESLLKSKDEIGPFGAQGENGDNYRITHYAEKLILSPLIPRSLLWEFSIGDFANYMSYFSGDGFHLDTLPAYLVGICASPTASINLLKAINEIEPDFTQVSGFCFYIKRWVQFPLLVNPVTDIWLLATLEPANIANSFFNSSYDIQEMDEDKDCLDGGVLLVYNWDFLSDGIREIFKLSQNLSFNEELFATALLGQRIIEEFKCERARIEDHIDSESGIVRAVVFCSPSLESSAKQRVNQEDSVFKNQDFMDLITLFWARDDLSVVV